MNELNSLVLLVGNCTLGADSLTLMAYKAFVLDDPVLLFLNDGPAWTDLCTAGAVGAQGWIDDHGFSPSSRRQGEDGPIRTKPMMP